MTRLYMVMHAFGENDTEKLATAIASHDVLRTTARLEIVGFSITGGQSYFLLKLPSRMSKTEVEELKHLVRADADKVR